MSSRNLSKQIQELKATRAFTPHPLGEEELAEILEAGRWTGSSLNSQPWTFVVVTDPGLMQALSETGRYATHLASAAVVMVLVGAPGHGEFDIGRAAQNMMLIADALGIGSCPATLHDEEATRRLLSIPDDRSARYAIALGYPNYDLEPTVRQNLKLVTGSARKPIDEIVRWNTYK